MAIEGLPERAHAGRAPTYAEWLKRLEDMERSQRELYKSVREQEGDAVGKAIERWICDGRARGFCPPDGRLRR